MLTSVGVELPGLCDMKKMCGQKGGADNVQMS